MLTWPSGPWVSAAGRGRRRRASDSSHEERCPGRPERDELELWPSGQSPTRRGELDDPIGNASRPLSRSIRSPSSARFAAQSTSWRAQRAAGSPREGAQVRRSDLRRELELVGGARPSRRARSTHYLRREDHRADARLAGREPRNRPGRFGRVAASWHMSPGLSPAGAGLIVFFRA
jgi:hypothetical protein